MRRRTKMNLVEAKAFQAKMQALQDGQDLDLDTMYEMRRDLEDWFQSGFCGIGVVYHFRDVLKEAIYQRSIRGTENEPR